MEREILRNLQAIVTDADRTPVSEVRSCLIYYFDAVLTLLDI
jgi:hypothetical protein